MFLTKNPFSDHGPSKQVLSEAFKYHIPEDIPANERTAFHGAAAAAAKAGKKNFNFGGKTHPVTMKKDLANKIADQKEAVTMDNERMKIVKHNQAMTNLKRLDKKHSGKDHADHMKVRMAVDKAGQTLNKHGAHSDQYKTAYASAKHLSNKHAQKESTMTFREKLLSLFEGDRKSHYKSATEPEGMNDKSKSSKGAMDMINTPKEVAADGKKAADDNAKKAAEKKMNKAKKRSGGDNIDKGDTKIVPGGTPVKEPSMKKEEYGMFGKKVSKSLLDAVAMVEDLDKKMTVDIDHMSGTAGSHEKKHGITLKKGKNYGKGPGQNMATFATGKKRDLQKYLKKHYDGDHKTMHPEIYKESTGEVTERKRTISTKKVKGDRSMHDQHAKTGYGMGGEQSYAAANNMRQTHYSKYISKKSGHDSYFDGHDLVHKKSNKTVVPNAFHGKHTPDQLADKMKAHGDKHKG